MHGETLKYDILHLHIITILHLYVSLD